MDLTYDDVEKILKIVDSAPHVDEIEFAYGDLRLRIHRGPTSSAKPSSQSSSAARSSTISSVEKPLRSPAEHEQTLSGAEIAVRAPVAGIFRRSPTQGLRPFVEVGQRVEAEDTLCLVGLVGASAIKAGGAGVVKEIVAEDGDLVEFDQLLIVIGADAQDCQS